MLGSLVMSASLFVASAAPMSAAFSATVAAVPCVVHAVGVPRYGGGAGAVEVQLDDGSRVLVTRASLSMGAPSVGDEFGGAVSLSRFDHCSELLIGAPGVGGMGAVFAAELTAGGWTAQRVQPVGLTAGDRFGAAVSGDFAHAAVGAPGRDVDGAEDAGAVFTYTPIAGASGRATVWTQGHNAPGAPESGDRFGTVVALNAGLVVVGQPHEDIGSATDAGMVTVFGLVGTSAARAWHQNSAGVPGWTEPGDHFGESLHVAEDYSNLWHVYVGVPDEDLGTTANAGLVQVIEQVIPGEEQSPVWVPGPVFTQSTADVAGVPESGDRFGAAITYMHEAFDGTQCLIFGAPGEDLGALANAGLVAMLCSDGPRSLAQGAALPGAAEAGDRTGATVAQAGAAGELHIGAPGEDLGETTDAGVVLRWDFSSIAEHGTSFVGGPIAGLRYGGVFPSATSSPPG